MDNLRHADLCRSVDSLSKACFSLCPIADSCQKDIIIQSAAAALVIVFANIPLEVDINSQSKYAMASLIVLYFVLHKYNISKSLFCFRHLPCAD